MNGKLKPLAWVLASVKKELEPLLEYEGVEVCPFHGQNLWKLEDSKGRTVLLATTGIGKVNAAFTVGALAEKSSKPQIIINFGIAGAYESSPVSIGDVVVVTECVMGDEGVWHNIDQISSYEAIGISPLENLEDAIHGRISLNFEKAEKLLPAGIYNPRDLLLRESTRCLNRKQNSDLSFRVWYGPSCSVGLASGSPEVAMLRQKVYKAWIEEMEVSAVVLGAIRMGIPVIAIRGVSNRAGERDKSRWQIDRAVLNACACATKILFSSILNEPLA